MRTLNTKTLKKLAARAMVEGDATELDAVAARWSRRADRWNGISAPDSCKSLRIACLDASIAALQMAYKAHQRKMGLCLAKMDRAQLWA